MPRLGSIRRRGTRRTTARQFSRRVRRNTRARARVPKYTGAAVSTLGWRIDPNKQFAAKLPFRPYYHCKLSYCETVTKSSGAAGVTGTEAIYRLNSLHSPQLSGGGTSHQPYGYDQVSALYRRYKVHGFKYFIQGINPSVDGLFMAVMLQGSSATGVTSGLTADILREQPMTTVKYINDSGEQKTDVMGYIDLSTLEGVTKTQFNAQIDDVYAGTVGGGPTRTPYLRVSVGDSGGNSGSTLVVNVYFKFYVTFFDRKVFAQS